MERAGWFIHQYPESTPEVWEAIPSPKVEYVRQAVAEKLERDGVEERR